MKRILFATSEAVPFIKTGGLADVAGALPKCFDKRYFDVRVILPKYACMKQEWKDKMEYITHLATTDKNFKDLLYMMNKVNELYIKCTKNKKAARANALTAKFMRILCEFYSTIF